MLFDVRALKGGGGATEMVSLALEAASETDARTELAARALTPLSIVPARGALRRAGGGFSVLLFSQEMCALLEAGLSVVEALDTLVEHTGGPARRALLSRLRRAIGEGLSLSRALEGCGGVFPGVYVGMVRAAETTSNLPHALRRYIDYQTRNDAVRAKIAASAVYPLILCAAGGAVTLFLMIYVVPRFAGVYEGSGRPLPWMSALLLDWGRLVAAHTGVVAVVLGAAAAAAAWLWARLARAGGLARLAGRVPGLRQRARIHALSRLYMTLGMLLDGGIPAVAALGMARDTVFGAERAAVDAALRRVAGGETLAAAFAAAGLSTPVAERFLRVGERSGNLGEMLMRSAQYYDAEIARWIERFTRAFEPLLMAAIGLVVGLIVVLLYMPIFDLAGSVQ